MIDGGGQYLQESKRGFPSPWVAFCKLTGLHKWFPHSSFFNHYYLGHLSAGKTQAIEAVAGACMMLHKQTFHTLGGFSERFFMYGEDIDLSKRIAQQGLQNYFLPHIAIIHFKGESTTRQSIAYIQNFYGAMHIYARMHHGFFAATCFGIVLSIIKWFKTLLLYLRPSAIALSSFDAKTVTQLSVVANDAYFLQIKPQLAQLFPAAHLAQFTFALLAAQPLPAKSVLLYCPAPHQIAQMIAIMQQIGNTATHLVHLAGTKSIVSSGNSNTKGWAVALPQ
jgi:N-acetylglucosaminyl-diphospho-decaprenol L-rhamnosyltransferase